MKPIFQTRFGGPNDPVEKQGNCFAACVASLLNIPLKDADTYLEGLATPGAVETGWWRAFVAWCGERDLVPLYLTLGDKATPEQCAYGKPGLRYIACGQSPRGLGHSVVYLDGELEHDPHPQGGGLVSVDAYVVLVRKS
jgi:hypothetical protein